MRRLLLALLLPLIAACAGVNDAKQAPQAAIDQALYRDGGAPALTIYTVVNNATGRGGHTALLINADHRALFDPAGSWYNDATPQRNDMHYGMTPALVELFEDHHARPTHHVVIQKISVPPEVARKAMRLAEAEGALPESFCTRATSRVLSALPGFERIKTTWFPVALSEQLSGMPGVVTTIRHDDEWQPHEIALGAHLTGR
ncbi:hypothetical protein ACFQXB_15950 [Plastorhodobacter daqingensis]|uniref:Lipoprotein n=1 Tax=Plastorhodobacter daqingensis TaxID=1387281 RepID=A0ABW2UR26_9RHOB